MIPSAVNCSLGKQGDEKNWLVEKLTVAKLFMGEWNVKVHGRV
jgi:hypothetical protein